MAISSHRREAIKTTSRPKDRATPHKGNLVQPGPTRVMGDRATKRPPQDMAATRNLNLNNNNKHPRKITCKMSQISEGEMSPSKEDNREREKNTIG